MTKNRVAAVLKNPQPFDQIEPPTKYSSFDVGVIASSFKPENPLEELFPGVDKEGVTSPKGNLRYVKLPLPKGVGLPIAGLKSLWYDNARAYFNDDIDIPALWFRRPEEGCGNWNVWMSLSPMEIWSSRSGVRAATKKVVVAGLGMGYLLRRVAEKPTVKEIVVIEKDQELLDWFGTELCTKTSKVKDVICDDIWNQVDKFENYRMLIDIWKGYGDAEWDPRLKELRKKRKYVWAWGSPRGPRY